MFLKLIIAYSILILKADSQIYQTNNDFERFILANIPQFDIDPSGHRNNLYPQWYPQNTDQSYNNNGLGADKRSSDHQSNLWTQQPTQKNKKQAHQTVVQQQKQTHVPTTQKSVAIPLHLQQQAQLQIDQQQNLQQQLNGPQQPNLYEQNQQQNLHVGQTSYQQNGQPQRQNIQQQQQQQNFQQNIRPLTQPIQQNLKPQQQNYQNQQQYNLQNQQNQQQYNLQNQQNQQQYNLQNQQNQQQYNLQNQQIQQSHFQNQQNQQPFYQQHQQPQVYGQSNQNFNPGQTNTQSTSTVLQSKFGTDNTGKTGQNANFNSETLAITKFALKLFKTVNSQGNSVVSPYSIALLLALVQQGSSGNTQQEITQALQMTPEASQALFKGLTAFMKKRGTRNILKVASNMYIANGFTLDKKFKSNAINAFGSDVTTENFNDQYGASARINDWVSKKTNNKITNLLRPDSITPQSLMLLVNAVYFKGTWDTKFRPELTEDNIFILSDGTQKLSKFMHATRMVRTDVDPVLKSQIMILPFEGSEYSMMFILPLKGNNVNNVLQSLTEPQLYSYQNLGPKEVKIQIPKFTIQQDSDVQSVLSALGLWNMFSDGAELSGIGHKNGISPRISSGIHSALLSIDENGGSATAATSLSVVALSYDDPTTSFTADRPFIAILWDNKLTTPLFMAKVEDPEF